MAFKRSVSSVLVLVCLIALSSVVALKASFDIPEFPNALAFYNCNAVNFYEPEIKAGPQNKILVAINDRMITREHIIVYIEKQENSPPG